MEGNCYVDLLKSRTEIKEKYNSENEKLFAKKERLWSTMDISKWEIVEDPSTIDTSQMMRDKTYAFSKMCTRDNQSLDNIHKQLGYANKMNTEELKKLTNSTADKIVNMVKTFAEVFYPTLSDGINIWSGLNTYL